jgi:hypothetical protein
MCDCERYLSSFQFGGIETMDEQVIAIFCICDEIVKSYGFPENPNYKMTTAEVMTFAIVSGLHYHADYHTYAFSRFSLAIFSENIES